MLLKRSLITEPLAGVATWGSRALGMGGFISLHETNNSRRMKKLLKIGEHISA